MKCNWYLVLLGISLVALMGATAGCITFVREPAPIPEETMAPPKINFFSASPDSLIAGERTTLSWDVAGASTITIQPEIGSVGPSGSLQLSPAATVTYTLTASNEAGDITGSVTLMVTPVFAGKPDLVITDIWFSGDTIYYKIKNQGDAEAKPTRSILYVYDIKEATDYVDSVAVGEEKTASFSNWRWPYPPAAGGIAAAEPFAVKVCADSENAVEESNKDNNCARVIWGSTFTYDFVKQAHLAEWRSNAGELTWPMAASGSKGAAYVLADTIAMCPDQVSDGWILGRFADYYSEFGETRSQEIEVPKYARFTARVGFQQEGSSTDGVGVALGYVDTTGSVVLFPKIDVYSDGISRAYEIDLSDMAGKKTEFILWVEARSSPVGDCVMWLEPKIVQK